MDQKKIIAIVSILFTLTFTRLEAAVITPVDMTGLRSFDGGANVLLLTFDAVKLVTEDRTIVHFDISGLSGTFSNTVLDIPINNIDPGLPGGIFEVYAFAGDGTVSIEEWSFGTLFQTFTGIAGGEQTLSTNITSLLQTAVDNGDTYLSLNFRGGNNDRYWLSDIFSLPEPSINTVPLPPALWLFGFGLSLFCGMRRKVQ